MEKKLRKGQIVSYHHNGNDETLYFGKVLSNTAKVLELQSLDAPILHETRSFDSQDKLEYRFTVYTVENKERLKKLLEDHRQHGLQEAKKYLKEFKSLSKINKKKSQQKRKEFQKKIKKYKNLKFFYNNLVEFLLPG